MANNIGLTETGFVPLSLSEVQADLQAQMQLQFGNVDLSDQSVFGQLIGIVSASTAQLWQAAAAIYSNSYPAGASGVAVDNILALNNLTRLAAAPSVTNPTPATQSSGVVLYGLRLLGTPGTVIPAGTTLSNGAASPTTFSLDNSVTIGPANNAQQVVYFSGVPSSGTYALTLTDPAGDALTTDAIPYNALATTTQLFWSSAPEGNYTLTLGGTNTTNSMDGAFTASQVQASINSLQGFGALTVNGSVASGLNIVWPAGFIPVVTASGPGGPTSIVDATSAHVHELANSAGSQPFTDVLLSDGTQALNLSFGAFAPQSGQPSTAAVAIPAIQIASTTLNVANVSAKITVVGNPAQGIGTATATVTGASAVLAGQLTTIATPVSGLTGVTNDLDTIAGRAAETDSEALARLKQTQGSTATGSLGSIVKRVQGVSGVSQVVGFQNTSNAAGQVVLFASPPSSGSFSLLLGGQTTASLAYNAAASDVQAAIRALNGFAAVQVTPYGQAGFQLDFSGVRGGQGLALAQVAQNTTQVALTAYFGRPPHSVEIVVEGGSDADVAQAILSSLPAGVSAFSNPTLRTTATLTAGSATASLASAVGINVGQTVDAAGVPLGTTLVALSETTATLSAAATASGSQVPIAFNNAPLVKDAAGNSLAVGFSRPIQTLVFVDTTLVTDIFNTPGDNTSGTNSASQFNPSSLSEIQQDIIAIVNSTPIGSTLYARGTNGLVGSFRQVPGVVDVTLTFGLTPNPTSANNLNFQPNQAPTAQSSSVLVTYK